MSRPFVSPTSGKPEAATLSSTANWREWWRAESERAGTDWPTLVRQHLAALSAAVCELSGPSS
jgi:hypothetical protein